MTPILAFFATNLVAQAAAPTGPQSILGNPMVMMVVMVVVFYFLLIRPQQKQRKEQAERVAALVQGDRVVTSAGIHGIVHNVKEHTVIVKVAEGTMLEFDKAAITIVHKKDSAK
ncbi:preprotein translocase subunit YajC [Luteolibacter yonseiensis]|uniref:Sec translocon accessory complex subunit YajC n=1 Tax=Luteolibacter yonseiensis TaxID=1144680 RepID=A0A934R326_9BACT|nr:preprotein translocase subunit YajC [Luteolibacter yonseiensis]MBK1815552.1 preprotein translocase subunit YajC [Luteolibacter yonseiensis]